MTEKKDVELSNPTVLLIDCQLKIGTLINLMISKNVFTESEFQDEIKSLSEKIAREMVNTSVN